MCKCLDCLRILMIVFNFLFMLFGMAILGLSLYFYFISFAKDTEINRVTMAIFGMMAIGGLTLILGIFGCCGAYHKSQCLLGSYFVLLLLVFAGEIAIGIVGILNREKAEKEIAKTFDQGVKDVKEGNQKAPFQWMDFMQVTLQCCGKGTPILDYGFNIPKSCCFGESSCENDLKSFFVKAKREGCDTKLKGFIKEKMLIICGVLLAIALIEFLGLVFSMTLCCNVRSYSYVGYDDVPMA